MNEVETFPWDMADHIETKEDVVAYLNAAFEEEDPRVVIAFLDAVARSRLGKEARTADASIESFQQGLESGFCDFVLTIKWIQSLGLEVRVSDAPVTTAESSLQQVETVSSV